ncbi:MAG: SDR family NAD(P)-dependent oxidoreductase [Planctomycetota bacterium]|nr:SDR family NAD(P)-dependent oxidoreductase [Planctomycetota bacterium]
MSGLAIDPTGGHHAAMARRRTVFLTGATDGLGLELARLWNARCERLILHGRRPLEELDPALFRSDSYFRADLAAPEPFVGLSRYLDDVGVPRIDLLVHNAAAGYYGPFERQGAESVGELVRVNLEAPLELTQLLLPRLRAAGGRIVFISSIAAALPCPDFGVYAATKAALEGFARSLRVELTGEVGVQVIRPGATRTGMHAKSGATREEVDWERFPPAEKVARGIVKAIDAESASTTIGAGNKLVVAAGRNLAGPLDAIARRHRR